MPDISYLLNWLKLFWYCSDIMIRFSQFSKTNFFDGEIYAEFNILDLPDTFTESAYFCTKITVCGEISTFV